LLAKAFVNATSLPTSIAAWLLLAVNSQVNWHRKRDGSDVGEERDVCLFTVPSLAQYACQPQTIRTKETV
jgi:hypothetical protein